MDRSDEPDKDLELMCLLKALPSPDHDNRDKFGLILCAVISGSEHGWTDDFIRICKANADKDFGEVIKLILTEDCFPPLEIVDDE